MAGVVLMVAGLCSILGYIWLPAFLQHEAVRATLAVAGFFYIIIGLILTGIAQPRAITAD